MAIRTVFLCTPSVGGHHDAYTWSLFVQSMGLSEAGLELLITHTGQPRHAAYPAARNWGFSGCLTSKADAVLFWDADMAVTTPNGIAMLALDDKPIVAALCRSRHTGSLVHTRSFCVTPNGGTGGIQIPPGYIEEPGVYPVESSGTGVLMVRADVIYEMLRVYVQERPPHWAHPWFEWWGCGQLRHAPQYSLDHRKLIGPLSQFENRDWPSLEEFHSMPGAMRSGMLQQFANDVNEDSIFSLKCNELCERGFDAQMWLDTRVRTSHYGEMDYTTEGLRVVEGSE